METKTSLQSGHVQSARVTGTERVNWFLYLPPTKSSLKIIWINQRCTAERGFPCCNINMHFFRLRHVQDILPVWGTCQARIFCVLVTQGTTPHTWTDNGLLAPRGMQDDCKGETGLGMSTPQFRGVPGKTLEPIWEATQFPLLHSVQSTQWRAQVCACACVC